MVGAKNAALFTSRMSNERSADELRPPKNGAGERSRTVVSALARPHSAVEPHPLEMESHVRVALICEVLRTTAWAARPTGHFMRIKECKAQDAGRKLSLPAAPWSASWRP